MVRFVFVKTQIYKYNKSKDSVVREIESISEKAIAPFSDSDFQIFFNDENVFTMNLISSFSRNYFYEPTLLAEIKEISENEVQIATKAKPNIILSFLVVIAFVWGGGYLFEYFQTSDIGFLIWSLSLIVFTPLFCIFFTEISRSALYERYDKYIDKKLKE